MTDPQDLEGFADGAAYSDDERYRWWFERRWSDGPLVSWVGLNPGTGDTDGKHRPTLRGWCAGRLTAASARCGS